ncbi:MAG: hypothetical protein QXU21_05790 [Candidatus Bathyarchaeia archaeon]
MVKLPRMGRPPFLKSHHVKQDDIVKIVEEPYVRSAEESRFEKPRGYAVVRLVRTGELYTWGFNTTTWDRLIDAFGEDSALWKGKKVKVKLENQTVRGEQKQIIFGVPYREPQQKLAVEKQHENPLDADLMAKVKALPLEQRRALLEALNESPVATATS